MQQKLIRWRHHHLPNMADVSQSSGELESDPVETGEPGLLDSQGTDGLPPGELPRGDESLTGLVDRLLLADDLPPKSWL